MIDLNDFEIEDQDDELEEDKFIEDLVLETVHLEQVLGRELYTPEKLAIHDAARDHQDHGEPFDADTALRALQDNCWHAETDKDYRSSTSEEARVRRMAETMQARNEIDERYPEEDEAEQPGEKLTEEQRVYRMADTYAQTLEDQEQEGEQTEPDQSTHEGRVERMARVMDGN